MITIRSNSVRSRTAASLSNCCRVETTAIRHPASFSSSAICSITQSSFRTAGAPAPPASVDCAVVDFELSSDQRALAEAARSLLDGKASSEQVRAHLASGEQYDAKQAIINPAGVGKTMFDLGIQLVVLR